ncbi:MULTISPECIES: AAA family ATPase [unclassified Vibrio]|uniref:McrB family protein n=1 Tax=unclassified Vibrio TaxID=2614977 RepID=UPI001F0DB875|nr:MULTISPECIES: AAA family ATPase [unclassified Vibrio]
MNEKQKRDFENRTYVQSIMRYFDESKDPLRLISLPKYLGISQVLSMYLEKTMREPKLRIVVAESNDTVAFIYNVIQSNDAIYSSNPKTFRALEQRVNGIQHGVIVTTIDLLLRLNLPDINCEIIFYKNGVRQSLSGVKTHKLLSLASDNRRVITIGHFMEDCAFLKESKNKFVYTIDQAEADGYFSPLPPEHHTQESSFLEFARAQSNNGKKIFLKVSNKKQCENIHNKLSEYFPDKRVEFLFGTNKQFSQSDFLVSTRLPNHLAYYDCIVSVGTDLNKADSIDVECFVRVFATPDRSITVCSTDINLEEIRNLFGDFAEKGESQVKTNCVNQILYGPPGTGKTYNLQQLQANYTSQTEGVDAYLWLQEKIAPLNWMQVLVLSLLSLDKKAKVSDIVASKYFQTKAKVNNRDGNLSQTAWSYLQKFTVPNSTTVNYKGRGEPAVFDKTSDSVWHLLDDKLELVDELLVLYKELEQGPPPGAVVKRFSSTTFHQSYGYEEFIEGLRASTDDEGNVHYSVELGEFLKLCRRAEQDPDSQYAMFIDEINRGNISKIFGELISLVETDKRKDGAHPMSVNLAYSGRPFSVPSNVDIIGTMNTADRSIALMDTALRRRFEFIEMMPDIRLFESDGLIDIGNNQYIDLGELLKSLNDRIEALYDREHTLGHAFFFPAYNAAKAGNHDEAVSNLAKAFIGKIVPLLQEYFHDDWSKIRLVLGDNQKLGSARKELQALQFVRREKVEYQRLFGNQYEPDGYVSDEYRYTLADQNDDIWTNGECYLAVYKPQLSEELAAQVMDEN